MIILSSCSPRLPASILCRILEKELKSFSFSTRILEITIESYPQIHTRSLLQQGHGPLQFLVVLRLRRLDQRPLPHAAALLAHEWQLLQHLLVLQQQPVYYLLLLLQAHAPAQGLFAVLNEQIEFPYSQLLHTDVFLAQAHVAVVYLLYLVDDLFVEVVELFVGLLLIRALRQPAAFLRLLHPLYVDITLEKGLHFVGHLLPENGDYLLELSLCCYADASEFPLQIPDAPLQVPDSGGICNPNEENEGQRPPYEQEVYIVGDIKECRVGENQEDREGHQQRPFQLCALQ